MPAPAPLLDASKYKPGVGGRVPKNPGGVVGARKAGSVLASRPTLQRPYSFTHGVIPEVEFSQALGAQLGIVKKLERNFIPVGDKEHGES